MSYMVLDSGIGAILHNSILPAKEESFDNWMKRLHLIIQLAEYQKKAIKS